MIAKIVSTGPELIELVLVLRSVDKWYAKCGFRFIYLSLDSHLSPATCVAGLFLCFGSVRIAHLRSAKGCRTLLLMPLSSHFDNRS